MMTRIHSARCPVAKHHLALVLTFACAMTVMGCQSAPSTGVGGRAVASSGSDEADRYRIVDCLLPGNIRRIGTMAQYVSRPQLIETAARDCEIRGGEYVAKDPASYAAALNDWEAKAERGDIKAMLYVGEIYQRGLAGATDPAKAAQWYRRAAELGSAEAQVNLAVLYERGAGVPMDKTEAARWYLRARGVSEDQLATVQRATPPVESAEAKRLRTELQAAEQERFRLRSQIAQLQQSIEDTQSDRARERLLEEERSRHLEQISKLQQDLNAKDKQVVELERQATTPVESAEAKRLRTELQAAEQERIRLRSQIAQMQQGIENAQLDRAEQQLLEEERSRYQEQNSKLQQQISELQQDLNAKDKQVAELERQATREVATTGSKEPPGAPPSVFAGLSFGNYHALVIGNRNYQDPAIVDLKNPDRDARAIAQLLETKYGMQVTTVIDGTEEAIWSALGRINSVTGPGDNLLIYYAGHGKLEQQPEKQYIEGYWLPVDSSTSNQSKWINTDEINKFMKKANARHILVIADSCYAGSQFRSTPEVVERRELVERLNQKPARVLLTSGGQEDKVLDAGFEDHSVFAQVILDKLSANTQVILASELFERVRPSVISAARAFRHEQTPEYGPIQFAGDQGGEFFFVPRGAAQAVRDLDPQAFAQLRLSALGYHANHDVTVAGD